MPKPFRPCLEQLDHRVLPSVSPISATNHFVGPVALPTTVTHTTGVPSSSASLSHVVVVAKNAVTSVSATHVVGAAPTLVHPPTVTATHILSGETHEISVVKPVEAAA